ncbi:hypothetical protein LIER_14938 [Lithospermum erythrorhizon]|uniref:Reverse transcriptase Ty1/copia-type domain-containing protein n=1 Tax=Lithospermum erythrorhizon TaxID=34254 RepID=A0AAV3Q2V5_LITER
MIIQEWLEQSKNDYSYDKSGTSAIVIVVVCVDDILLTGSGLKIGRSNRAITMTQCKYTSELIQDSGILQSTIKHKVPQTPLPLHCKLVPNDTPGLKDPETGLWLES